MKLITKTTSCALKNLQEFIENELKLMIGFAIHENLVDIQISWHPTFAKGCTFLMLRVASHFEGHFV